MAGAVTGVRPRIPGPPPGTWVTDVVPTPDGYAVLLLHFSRRGDPRPPLALHVPEGVPWA